ILRQRIGLANKYLNNLLENYKKLHDKSDKLSFIAKVEKQINTIREAEDEWLKIIKENPETQMTENEIFENYLVKTNYIDTMEKAQELIEEIEKALQTKNFQSENV